MTIITQYSQTHLYSQTQYSQDFAYVHSPIKQGIACLRHTAMPSLHGMLTHLIVHMFLGLRIWMVAKVLKQIDGQDGEAERSKAEHVKTEAYIVRPNFK